MLTLALLLSGCTLDRHGIRRATARELQAAGTACRPGETAVYCGGQAICVPAGGERRACVSAP